MKKIITTLYIIIGISMMSINAMGQAPQPNFIAHTTAHIENMAIQNGIEVTYQPGYISSSDAFCLAFRNKSNAGITFTYSLLNKNGDIVYTSPQAYLDANMGMGFGIVATEGFQFEFPVAEGMTAADYKISINLKQ